MTARDERGRFVRADAQPVLHRQVPDPCRPRQLVEVLPSWRVTWKDGGEKRQWANEHETPALVSMPQAATYWLEPMHAPRSRWPLVFFVCGLILVAVMGTWLAAVDGGLLP